MYRLIVGIPPSVNHSHINIREGNRNKRIRSQATKEYMIDTGWLAKRWMVLSKWHMPDKDKKIIMRVWIYWPDNRRRDADNLIKILQDSLTHILWHDDRQVLPQIIGFAVPNHILANMFFLVVGMALADGIFLVLKLIGLG